jgi:hypothetical protein
VTNAPVLIEQRISAAKAAFAVDAAGDFVAGGDGEEGASVVVEADGFVKAGGFVACSRKRMMPSGESWNHQGDLPQGASSLRTPISDDETAAKMGHPTVEVRSDVGHPSNEKAAVISRAV